MPKKAWRVTIYREYENTLKREISHARKRFKKTSNKMSDEEQGQRKRNRECPRSKERTDALNDIGNTSDHEPKRRKACENDLLLFLTTYFPFSTGLSHWGQDQIDAIRRIEVAIKEQAWVCQHHAAGFNQIHLV